MRRIVLWLALALAPPACTPAPKAVPIRGPDGTPMLHVSCGSDEARCYQLAGESCPMGYELATTAGSAGNFLVRCRTAFGFPPASVPTPVAPSYSGVSNPQQPVPGYPPLSSGQTDPNDVGY